MKPPAWTEQELEGLKVKPDNVQRLIQLDRNENVEEYQQVESSFLGTLKEPWNFAVVSIQKNYDPYTHTAYQAEKIIFEAKKPESVETMLFHGTSYTCPTVVLKQGLDRRPGGDIALYGALEAEYCTTYKTYSKWDPDLRCRVYTMLSCRALLGSVGPSSAIKFSSRGSLFDSLFLPDISSFALFSGSQLYVQYVINFTQIREKISPKRRLKDHFSSLVKRLRQV